MTKQLKFDVVGLNHRLSKIEQELMAEVVKEVGYLKCELEREPQNQADPNAVKVNVVDQRLHKAAPKVFTPAVHIGYIRKEVAAVIAQGMDRGTLKVKLCRLTFVKAKYGWGSLKIAFLKTPAKKLKTRT